MNAKHPSIRFIAACALLALITAPARAAFLAPGQWNVADPNTTYQEWDNFSASAGNEPDVGYSANPAVSTLPTTSAVAPGFRTGSGNFYSFSGNHGFSTLIHNHGGPSGAGGLPVGSGTHVIVQTAATLNAGVGVYPDTLQIVDPLGNPLAGGDNASALHYDVAFEGIVGSPAGNVLLRFEIWEFFLPNYVDDFRVNADLIIHSSFSQVRVDSAVAAQAYAVTAVPEPGSLALAGAFGLVLSRRTRRKWSEGRE